MSTKGSLLLIATWLSVLPYSTAVVNGQDVEVGEFPWIAWGSCNGALVSPRHVITAKHCYNHPANMTVSFNKTSAKERGHEMRKITKISLNMEVDVAILTLSRRVNIKPIGLPAIDSDYTGKTRTLAGPGCDQPHPFHSPEVLQKVDLRVIPIRECRKVHGKANSLTDSRWLCATSPVRFPWRSGCTGDSGSPMFACGAASGDCALVAVVHSGGPGVRNGQGDSVGSKVSSILPWIRTILDSDQ